MNAQVKPAKLGANLAYNHLQSVVQDCVDDYARTHWAPSLDAFALDFARHLARNEQARFVEYVKERTDWPSVATDDALVGAEALLACYKNPEKFRELVDAALFRHFQNAVEWEDDIHAILKRNDCFKKESAA